MYRLCFTNLAPILIGYSRNVNRPPRAALMSLLGQERKSVTATRMSAFGVRAEVDFGRLEVCL